MRHGKKLAKLGRPADQRKALLRSLTTELLRHGKIKTTKVSFTLNNFGFSSMFQFLVSSCGLFAADQGESYEKTCGQNDHSRKRWVTPCSATGVPLSSGSALVVARNLADVLCVTQALSYVFDKTIVATLFNEVPARYGERSGGYTRIKTEPRLRRGDAAEMATIELV